MTPSINAPRRDEKNGVNDFSIFAKPAPVAADKSRNPAYAYNPSIDAFRRDIQIGSNDFSLSFLIYTFFFETLINCEFGRSQHGKQFYTIMKKQLNDCGHS